MSARFAAGILAAGLLSVTGWAGVAGAQTAVEAPASAAPAAPASRLARLQGSVRLERNRPVIGAAVAIVPESGGEVLLTTTDSRGTFRMDGIPDGFYTVVFQRAGLATIRKEHVELKAPFRPTVEVIMRPGSSLVVAADSDGGEATLLGRATEREGAGVSDLKVRLIPVKGDTDPVNLVSDANGEFKASGLATGPWTVEARGLAYLPIRATIPLSGGEHRVRFVLVPQPAAYDPIPLDLLPPEEPIPPPDPAPASDAPSAAG